MSRCPSVPIRKFANHCGTSDANFGIKAIIPDVTFPKTRSIHGSGIADVSREHIRLHPSPEREGYGYARALLNWGVDVYGS
jgi:hypothetical protein